MRIQTTILHGLLAGALSPSKIPCGRRPISAKHFYPWHAGTKLWFDDMQLECNDPSSGYTPTHSIGKQNSLPSLSPNAKSTFFI